MNWEVINKSSVVDNKSLLSVLLKNRGISSSGKVREFLSPQNPAKINLNEVGVNTDCLNKTVKRIKKAKKNNEFVIIYGDYDADGITATAILWETLHEFGLDVLPYIPDRFEDGYGIKPKSVEKLKEQFSKLSLIITIDNGVVAYDGVDKASELGIDVVVIDHHQKGDREINTKYLIHDTSICGSALAWFFSKEILPKSPHLEDRLALACIGTIADQMSLTGTNRSIVKFGLEYLNNTKRPGLTALYKEARVASIGQYEVGFVIAPRINSMGRLKHGLDSLRLLCTRDNVKALKLSSEIGQVNIARQKIVDEVVEAALKEDIEGMSVIVLGSPDYHEGVIGLAAAKLVEKFYRPAIVFSQQKEVSKASARSIAGFNIIEAIRKVNLHLEGGGHPMAAGFSIETERIDEFRKEINKIAKRLITKEILEKKLKVDCAVGFELISSKFMETLRLFEPTGNGNPQPTFVTRSVEVIDARQIGRESKHLKLKLKQNEHVFDSIYFGGGEMYPKLDPGVKIDIVYTVDENVWNGYINIQLRLKDIRV